MVYQEGNFIMTLEKSILAIVPGLQATALVGMNMKAIPKKFDMKKQQKITPNKMVKIAVANFIGIGLMKPTAKIINALP